MAACLWSCVQTEPEVAVTGVTLSQNSAELVVGDVLELKATVSPDNATDKTIEWSSSVVSVATVDGKGKVTAVGVGKAVIIAKAGTILAPCTVMVSPAKIDITELKLNKTSLSLFLGDEETLMATIIPENATVQTVLWSSANPEIATVDDGKVTALKEGTTTITASADGKTAECSVTVDYIHVSGISLDQTDVTLTEGESCTLTATFEPENATYPALSWTSSDAYVAAVSGGVVTAVAPGSAVITVSADGKNATCQITVEKAPDPLPTEPGIYIAGQSAYEFNPKEQQISIYSAEGKSWFRFLFPATLMMYQVGPIPESAKEGDKVNIVLETYTSGVETAQAVSFTLVIQSMDGVKMTLASDQGDLFILRY